MTINKIFIRSRGEDFAPVEIGMQDFDNSLTYNIGRNRRGQVIVYPFYGRGKSAVRLLGGVHTSVSRDHLELLVQNEGILVKNKSRNGTMYLDDDSPHGGDTPIEEDGLFLKKREAPHSLRLGTNFTVYLTLS